MISYDINSLVESKQDPISFNIHIYLDNDTKNALPINKSDPVGEFTLSITFTPTYPESAPLFKLIDIENISPTDCHLINNLIQETIKDNIGCQMIYSIVMVCKEEIERSVRDRRNLQAKQLDERLRADHEAEVLRSQGTKVTAASFNAWNEKVFSN